MRNKLERLMERETIRYLIAGGATTLVNLVVFYFLRSICGVHLNTSNFIAILLAIIFAYVVNKCFVFHAKVHSPNELLQEVFHFFGARLVTMMIEMVGVGIFAGILHLNEMASKLIVQVIVLILNYVFSKLFVFNRKKEGQESFGMRYQLYFLAFLVPFFLLLVICMIYEVEPFGDHSLVIIDGLHQYMPFFSEYQNKLQHGESLFYSWNSGLGINFMALWAYYLASPLNLVIVFFPQRYLNGVVSMLIITKIALSSFTMAVYLKNAHWAYKKNRTIKPKSWQILIFSMAYALSSYMIGYSWNVMWLETMIFLPLIILGVEKLIEQGDGRYYCLFLFASLYCNFYMTFMTCLFLILYFLLYPHKSFKKFIQKGFIFAGYSLLAGAMAAILLIPTYEGLMVTSSAKMQFPEPEFYVSFFDTLNSHSIGADVITNAQADGGTNLYCGILTIFLVPLYLMNRKIKLSVRLKQTLLMIFLIVSFNLNWLNYIWHGFHDQYGIPNRFAYLYVFMSVCMAYQVLLWIKNYRPYQIIWSFGVLVGVMILSSIFSDTKEPWYSYLLTGVLALSYMTILLMYTGWKMKKIYLSYIIGSIMIVELGAHAIFGYACTGQITVSKFFSTTEEMSNARTVMLNDTDLYRAELAKAKMLDEVTWNRLPGVSLFGSTAIGDVVYTMGRLGFYSAVNEYLYRGATPVTDAILGVKYLFVRPGEEVYGNFDYYKSIGQVDLYRNYEALPIGYMVSNRADEIVYETGNPFETQNNWIAATMEDPVTVFEEVSHSGEIQLNGCESTYQNGGTVSYEMVETRDDNMIYTILPEKDTDLYVFITGNQIERIQIKNGEQLRCNEKLNSQVIHVGEVKAGVPVTISLRIKSSPSSGQIRMMAANFKEDAFLEYYNAMAQQPYEVTKHTANSIKGTVEAAEDGIFFTSIPYDRGWKITVDGKELEEEEVLAIADAFIGLQLKEGQHKIEFLYTPVGYEMGRNVTIISVGIFLLCNLYHYHRKRRSKTFM